MSSAEAQTQRARNSIFHRFVHSQVSGSIVLLACTIVALIWANSPWAESYFELIHVHLTIGLGDMALDLSLKHWVNDALMVVFFFVVGLEIKRELVLGELSTVRKAVLPVMAALGGMVVPALLYVMVNRGDVGASGWGVPMATDIAFALGILAMFGTRAPLGLKVFLTALAIADDLGAVMVIALFYTEKVSFTWLAIGGVFLFLMVIANRFKVRRVGLWTLLVVGVWIGVFASGVHATVAGILVAMVVPIRARIKPEEFTRRAEASWAKMQERELTQESMVQDREQLHAIMDIHEAAGDMRPPGLTFEHYIHPAQAFLILPLFAFFNAGVAIKAEAVSWPWDPITLGIVLGLVLGKQIGIVSFSWLAVKSGRASLPAGVDWGQIWAVSALAGIGFTMSLFISELAFKDPVMIAEAKIGILIASLVSGVLGYILLSSRLKKSAAEES